MKFFKFFSVLVLFVFLFLLFSIIMYIHHRWIYLQFLTILRRTWYKWQVQWFVVETARLQGRSCDTRIYDVCHRLAACRSFYESIKTLIPTWGCNIISNNPDSWTERFKKIHFPWFDDESIFSHTLLLFFFFFFIRLQQIDRGEINCTFVLKKKTMDESIDRFCKIT